MTTGLGIVTSSMRKIGVLTKNQSPSADEASDGLEMLNDLIASLSNDSLIIYSRTVENFTLSAGTASYTIGTGATFNTARPIRIVAAYVRSGGIDYSLDIVSDERYATIQLKSTQGSYPEHLNYTNAYPTGTINLYPAPSAADTLYLVSEKELSSLTLNGTVNLPPGWKRMLIYNLAIEMGPEYGQPVTQEIYEIARQSKGEIKAAVMAAKKMDWNAGLGIDSNINSGWNN